MNPTILAALALVATVSWVQSATVVFSATSIPELSTTALVAFGTILGLSRRHRDYPKRQNKPSLSTPISRPVYMLSRSFNLNPVIDARSR